jgi:hypothetical protein
MVVIGCIAACASFSRILAVGLGAALLGMTGEVLLPTAYRIGPEGLKLRSFGRSGLRPWASFEGWLRTPKGFLLKGKGGVRWLRQRRSVFIYCFDQAEQVEEYLVKHIHSGQR